MTSCPACPSSEAAVSPAGPQPIIATRRRLTGEKRGSFPQKGSNWFERPAPGVHPGDWPAAWDADRRLLDEMHRQLRAAVAGFDPARLSERWEGSKYVPYEQILGIAMHDVYHAGQIQVLKKLFTQAHP